jgi:ribosomal protein S27E
MQMSHPWMYGDRRTIAYREGVHSFCDAAKANKHGGGFMFYPCVECRNEKITLPQESFRATCFGPVSCLAIMFGPSTEKEGL